MSYARLGLISTEHDNFLTFSGMLLGILTLFTGLLALDFWLNTPPSKLLLYGNLFLGSLTLGVVWGCSACRSFVSVKGFGVKWFLRFLWSGFLASLITFFAVLQTVDPYVYGLCLSFSVLLGSVVYFFVQKILAVENADEEKERLIGEIGKLYHEVKTFKIPLAQNVAHDLQYQVHTFGKDISVHVLRRKRNTLQAILKKLNKIDSL